MMRRVSLYDGDGLAARGRRRGGCGWRRRGRRALCALPPPAAVHLLRRDEVRHDDLALLQPVRAARVRRLALNITINNN